MNLNLIKCWKPNEQKEMKLNNSMIEYAEWLVSGGKITASRSSSCQSISSKFSSNSNSFYSSVKKLKELDSPVKIMNELLHRYSHYKLQKFFEDETLRRFFTYFIKMEKENFISEFNESKKSKLVEAIEDFERNIQLFQ